MPDHASNVNNNCLYLIANGLTLIFFATRQDMVTVHVN